MHIFKRVGFVLSVGVMEVLIICAMPAATTRAEAPAGTHVSGSITSDTVWNPSGSPYVLNGTVEVAQGQTLTLQAGAQVIAAASSTISVRGRLDVQGTLEQPVDIGGPDIVIQPDGVMIGSFGYIHGGGTLHFVRSTGQIASMLVEGAHGPGLTFDGGWFRGRRLRIVGSGGPAVLIRSMATSSDPMHDPDIAINESSFHANTGGSVANPSGFQFNFTKNWWGTARGPEAAGADAVSGPLQYSEWLAIDPTIGRIPTGPKPACCSSILFIPGLKGTRLYDQNSQRIWEPFGAADISKLSLDNEGSSMHAVMAGKPIDEAYGLKGVYGSFMRFLDGLTGDGTINDWHAFGYDWRLPGGTDALNADSDAALAEAVRLAAASQTGKITVVAHSMGGFLAKKLLADIGGTGRSSMLDMFVSVAVPWTGAPLAIAGLLHGDRQEVAGGLLGRAYVLRDLAQNMPSAYGLLPIGRYFANALVPPIVFASTTIPGLNDGSYSSAIVAPKDQRAFMTDTAHVRMQPASVDISAALRSNERVFDVADTMRTYLESLSWPFRLTRWNLAGWNKDTAVTVAYDTRPGCTGFLGSFWCRGRAYFHRLITSIVGDGTVPLASAADEHDHLVTMDLGSISREEGARYSHGNILESSTTQDVLLRIMRDKNGASFGGLAGVASSTDLAAHERSHIDVFAHANVQLDVYDEHGLHTGLTAIPAQIAGNDSIQGAYEENIPDSSFTTTGEGSGKYSVVRLPYESGRTYSVVIRGKGYGFFTAGMEIVRPDSDPVMIRYMTVPISPIMTASTTIAMNVLTDAADPSTVVPPLQVDINTDGTPEYIAAAGGNGLPGNATTTEEADRVAREQLIEVLQKTDTPALHDDPERQALLGELFPPGTNGPITTTPPVQNPPVQIPPAPDDQDDEQKTPPSSGSASCP